MELNYIESVGTTELSGWSGRTATIDLNLRQFILNATKPQHNISLFYRELLESLLILFGDVKYRDDNGNLIPIKCVHANPERAIAAVQKENNLILPFMTVGKIGDSNDDDRSRPDTIVIHEVVWDDKERRAKRVISLAPRAISVRYGINIWSSYTSIFDQISAYIISEFNPHKIISTRSVINSKAYLINPNEDNTVLEVPDQQDKVLKKTFVVEVETYLPTPRYLLTSSGKIEIFGVDSELV